MLNTLAIGTVAALGMAVAASNTTAVDAPTKDVVETAVAAGSFTILTKALETVGLVQTLKGSGPFTVFAPTDEAFAKLPADTLEALLKPENQAKLRRILTYHVVPGRVMASDVAKLHAAKTVSGETIAIATSGGGVTVDKAHLVTTDIAATNGVIHVIDAVMLPTEK
jgi:uncharacterized surface protein with fasciclin (FAS1) repeats